MGLEDRRNGEVPKAVSVSLFLTQDTEVAIR